MMQIGRRLFATAAAALGAIGMLWGDFAIYWQPVPSDLPGHLQLAYLAGFVLFAGGIAAQFDRTTRVAGWALATVFAAFSVPWLIRVIRFAELFGTWGGLAEAFALVLASIIVAEGYGHPRTGAHSFLENACIRTFGICAIAFGLNHFFALRQTAEMVASWIPPGQVFWATATGIFHCAAGLAIVSGARALLAARLLGCMMLVFSALVWLPSLAASLTAHLVWAGNAENLALAGAAFVAADAIARHCQSKDAHDKSAASKPQFSE